MKRISVLLAGLLLSAGVVAEEPGFFDRVFKKSSPALSKDVPAQVPPNLQAEAPKPAAPALAVPSPAPVPAQAKAPVSAPNFEIPAGDLREKKVAEPAKVEAPKAVAKIDAPRQEAVSVKAEEKPCDCAKDAVKAEKVAVVGQKAPVKKKPAVKKVAKAKEEKPVEQVVVAPEAFKDARNGVARAVIENRPAGADRYADEVEVLVQAVKPAYVARTLYNQECKLIKRVAKNTWGNPVVVADLDAGKLASWKDQGYLALPNGQLEKEEKSCLDIPETVKGQVGYDVFVRYNGDNYAVRQESAPRVGEFIALRPLYLEGRKIQ